MNATFARGWQLALAGLLPLGSALADNAAPPAFLPPSSFAARLAARPLAPLPPDPTAAAEVAPTPNLPLAAEATAEVVAQIPIPSFSLQPDYERAMGCEWEHGMTRQDLWIDPALFERMHFPAVQRLELDPAVDASEFGLTPIELFLPTRCDSAEGKGRDSTWIAGNPGGGAWLCGRLALLNLRDGAAAIGIASCGGP